MSHYDNCSREELIAFAKNSGIPVLSLIHISEPTRH